MFHAYLFQHLQPENEDEIDAEDLNGPQLSGSIPLNLKYAMALQEEKLREKLLEELNTKVEEDVALLKAIIQSIKVRTNELRKETYEFQRDVIVKGENVVTGGTKLETVLEYWNRKIQEKAALAANLLRKTESLVNQRKKLEAQVKQKETMSDHLTRTDFAQLKIKNEQYSQRLKELSAELFSVKSTSVRTVQTLNARKQELQTLMQEGERLEQQIRERKGDVERLQSELEMVKKEAAIERNRNRKFKVQQSNPDIPHVIDYVRQKSTMYELEAECRNWERKVDIMNMAATRARTILNRVKQQRAARASSVASALQSGGNLYLPPL